MDDEERYEQGGGGRGFNGLAIGICLGVAIGVAIGSAKDNMGLWLPVGLCLGAILGLVLNKLAGGPYDKLTPGEDGASTEADEVSGDSDPEGPAESSGVAESAEAPEGDGDAGE